MKKPTRRDTGSRPPVPLDLSVLERVSAGHKSVDPIAGLHVFLPDDPAGKQ